MKINLNCKKGASLVLASALAVTVLAGCSSKPEPTEAPTEAPAETVTEAVTEAPAQTAVETVVPETQAAEEGIQKAFLYIGMGQEFTAYETEFTGEITPDALIAAIADLTGWDLSLADAVTTGKGGMTVNFSSQSALVVGPPQEQKEEFRVLDVTTLSQTILDSIQKTLQMYFVQEPGDPASLDIWYTLEGQELTIDGKPVPMDIPWDSEAFFG